jgi:hypothetical protein
MEGIGKAKGRVSVWKMTLCLLAIREISSIGCKVPTSSLACITEINMVQKMEPINASAERDYRRNPQMSTERIAPIHKL